MRSWTIAALAALTLSACTAKTPENLGQVEIATSTNSGSGSSSVDMSGNPTVTSSATTFGERFDAGAEEVIADETLRAWRVAVKHAKQEGAAQADWKKQRAADEAESMRQLEDLQKRYPKSSTVEFMMGQVKAHFGKHEEATQHFRRSTENNTNNSMYLFKLADSERKAGQIDKAIEHYREILKKNPEEDFTKTALAHALLDKDPKSAEAKQILDEVIKRDPENKEAKELLSR